MPLLNRRVSSLPVEGPDRSPSLVNISRSFSTSGYVANNLDAEEQKLRLRVKHRSSSGDSQVSNYSSLLSSSSDTDERTQLMENYRHKLGVFMVNELNKATQAEFTESEDIGLSFDDSYEHGDGAFRVDSSDVRRIRHFRADGERKIIRTIDSLIAQASGVIPSATAEQLHLKSLEYYFYDILGSYFGSREMLNYVENNFLPKTSRLLKHKQFNALYALLFHRYILHNRNLRHSSMKSQVTALALGASDLFASDEIHRTKRMFNLFVFLKTRVRDLRYRKKGSEASLKSSSGDLSKESEENIDSVISSLVPVLCRYYFFYCSSKRHLVLLFISHIGVSLDEFVECVVGKLSDAQGEVAIRVHYIEALVKLLSSEAGVNELLPDTVHLLQSVLSHAGVSTELGKTDKTVRSAAVKALSQLFPGSDWGSMSKEILLHMIPERVLSLVKGVMFKLPLVRSVVDSETKTHESG